MNQLADATPLELRLCASPHPEQGRLDGVRGGFLLNHESETSGALAAGDRGADTACVNVSPNETIRAVGALLILSVAPAQEVQERAFVEMTTDQAAYFVGQAIRVRIKFGIERGFLEKNVLQMFQGDVAVPAQLLVPWWNKLPGAVAGIDPESIGVTFVLNGQVGHARKTQEQRAGGEQFTVLEIQRTFRAERVGALLLPSPELRFGYATKFREDFVNGRVAEDSTNATVLGKAIESTIQPVPNDDRPAAFTGGVGSFTLKGDVSPREVTVGESVKLVLRIEGDGNLATLGVPKLESLSAFHIRGKTDDKGTKRRTITYDLMVIREVAAMQRIPFAFFDPKGKPRFRTVYTDAIPLDVKPLPEGQTLDLAGARTVPTVAGQNDIFDIKLSAARPGLELGGGMSRVLLLVLLVASWLAAFGLRSWLRVRRSHREPHRVRERGAAATYRSKVDESGEDAADALAEYIAARLHVSASAVIGTDLPAQLAAAGVSEALASQTAKVLEDLVASRYGGSTPTGGPEAARALVEALEAEFESLRRQR